MIEDTSSLVKGQDLKVLLDRVKDRLPSSLLNELSACPFGKLVGYKMVDGNRFGLVVELRSGSKNWFFEEELSQEID